MRPHLSALLAIAILPAVAACATGPRDCVSVEGQFDPAAPEFLVMYRQGVDAAATTDTLAARYGFTPINVYVDWFTMPAPQPGTVIAGMQCEPTVRAIEYDASIQPN